MCCEKFPIAASSELFDEGDRKGYKYWKSNPDRLFSAAEMIEKYAGWVAKYPIVSIEDPLDQNDWDGYVNMTKQLGGDQAVFFRNHSNLCCAWFRVFPQLHSLF